MPDTADYSSKVYDTDTNGHDIADIQWDLGAVDKAEELFRRIIEINPDNSSAIGNLLGVKGLGGGKSSFLSVLLHSVVADKGGMECFDGNE